MNLLDDVVSMAKIMPIESNMSFSLPHHNIIETRSCIKGIDFQNNATYNEYSLLKTLGGGIYSQVFLARQNHNF